MEIIVVDDERLVLENIVKVIRKVVPHAIVHGFVCPDEAILCLRENKIDIAFLDIEIGGVNGIDFSQRCKMLCPEMNVIFVTAYNKYAIEAFRLHASGYLMKPVMEEDIQAELENLRKPILLHGGKKVEIQTFGNFEIFVNNVPLHFPMAKCKECLAYLIDRKGALITTGEIAGVLWEDRPYSKVVQNNTHKVISDLMKTLKAANVEDIVIKSRREIGININNVDCDYYSFLNGEIPYINSFRGEYMSNYSWAEFTLSTIENDTNVTH